MPKLKAKPVAMKFSKDEFGKEILLKDGELQLRMEWEKPYMEACIDTLDPKGDVLEIGFGLGYAATRIQKHKPKSHTIIESNPEIAEKAKQWAEKQKGAKIQIIEDTWQNSLSKLSAFDAIFFDDYALVEQSDVKQLQQNVRQYQQAADQAGQLRNEIAKKLEQFRGLKFSDQDLADFAKESVQRVAVTVQDILEFIDNLAEMKNITQKQRTNFLKEFHERAARNLILRGITKEGSMQTVIGRVCPVSHFTTFIDECLKSHMRPKARLSAYVGSPEAEHTSQLIQDKILSRKDILVKEKTIPVDVPSNCQYYDGDKALILTIEKK